MAAYLLQASLQVTLSVLRRQSTQSQGRLGLFLSIIRFPEEAISYSFFVDIVIFLDVNLLYNHFVVALTNSYCIFYGIRGKEEERYWNSG